LLDGGCERIELSVVEMTEEEFENLPDFQG
jgi:hypothetical protein